MGRPVTRLVEPEPAPGFDDAEFDYRWLARLFLGVDAGPGPSAESAAGDLVRERRRRLDAAGGPVADRLEVLQEFVAALGYADAASSFLDARHRDHARVIGGRQ